jgi:hypothetical protein
MIDLKEAGFTMPEDGINTPSFVVDFPLPRPLPLAEIDWNEWVRRLDAKCRREGSRMVECYGIRTNQNGGVTGLVLTINHLFDDFDGLAEVIGYWDND